MSKEQEHWDALTKAEHAFMLNACESDILPGVWADLEDADYYRPVSELAGILLGLIDRGWVEVRRIEPWPRPSGGEGLQPGELVPRAQLPAILGEPANWEYRADGEWTGALTLVETEAGSKVSRFSPEELAEQALIPQPTEGTQAETRSSPTE